MSAGTSLPDGHAAALATLLAWQAPDEGQERLRTSYVEHLRQHADGHLRTCRPDHLTASVLVVSPDASRVLLTHHRRADAWWHAVTLITLVRTRK